MKTLSIQISNEHHNHVKAIAALKGLSIKDYVVSCILPSDEPNEATLMAIKEVELGVGLKEYSNVDDLISKMQEK